MGGTEAFVFLTKDLYGNTVSLTKRTWEDHILVGHADMFGKESLVQCAIEAPTAIYESPRGTNRFLFDKYDVVPNSDRLVRAVVAYEAADIEEGSTTGIIVTTWMPRKATAGPVGKLRYFSGIRRGNR